MTIFEALVNVGTGMVLAFTISQTIGYFSAEIQQYIWSGFVWNVSALSNVFMTVLLTVVSIGRGYCWRRVFNRIHEKELSETFESLTQKET